MNTEIRSYTVVLVQTAEGILLINRKKPPYRGLWNGLGGKIEHGETPLQGAAREIFEESGLQLAPDAFVDCGLVDWQEDGHRAGWLHLFSVATDASFKKPLMTREGVLAAWPKDWVQAKDNLGLVPDLVPLVGPLLEKKRQNYRSEFRDNQLVAFDVLAD